MADHVLTEQNIQINGSVEDVRSYYSHGEIASQG